MVDRIEFDASAEEAPQDNAQTQETPQERPEWLPDKFDSPEAMANAYSELEHKLGSGDSPETSEDTGETDGGIEDGFFDKYSQKYFQEGLSEEDYKAMESKGIPRQLVDQFAAGSQALMEQQQQSVYSEVGGEEQYAAMIEWAGNNLPEAEVQQFNNVIEGGVMTDLMMAVKGLQSRWVQNRGSEASLGEGSTKKMGDSAYQSTQQVIQDMNDPRYTKDPAFREQVQRRLANSNRL